MAKGAVRAREGKRGEKDGKGARGNQKKEAATAGIETGRRRDHGNQAGAVAESEEIESGRRRDHGKEAGAVATSEEKKRKGSHNQKRRGSFRGAGRGTGQDTNFGLGFGHGEVAGC